MRSITLVRLRMILFVLLLMAILAVTLAIASRQLAFGPWAYRAEAGRVVNDFCTNTDFERRYQAAESLLTPNARATWFKPKLWQESAVQCYYFKAEDIQRSGEKVAVEVVKKAIDVDGNLKEQDLIYLLTRADDGRHWLIDGLQVSRETIDPKEFTPWECRERNNYGPDDAMAVVEGFLRAIKLGHNDEAVLYVTPRFALSHNEYFYRTGDMEGWTFTLKNAEGKESRFWVWGMEKSKTGWFEARYRVIKTDDGYYLDWVDRKLI